VLADCRGFVVDLDGCVWQGDVLEPGAGEALTALHRAGRGVAFLTNNSRVTGSDIRAKLHRLGLGWVEHALTPLEILGQVIAERFGASRVLVIGSPELAAVVAAAGHEVLGVPEFRQATVVAVGNDFDLSYERLAAAARAAAAGAPRPSSSASPSRRCFASPCAGSAWTPPMPRWSATAWSRTWPAAAAPGCGRCSTRRPAPRPAPRT